MKNKVQLITYVDRLAGGGFAELRDLLAGPLSGIFGAVHLLPFFHPIDGSDAGFDPIDHTRVDARLGDWDSVRSLNASVDVMADVIVNHISVRSPQFADFSEKASASPCAGLFLTLDRVFPDGAREEDLLRIYRPRPSLPFTLATLHNGEKRVLWTTFTPEQIDIDVRHPQGRAYLDRILETFSKAGISMARLDAAGYAIKQPGTSCFMIPETFEFLTELAERGRALGIESLVEVHAYHKRQIEIAQRVDRVYDFALPPLVLHAIYKGDARPLKSWLTISPRNCVTVLDTHDGIGTMDVGAESSRPGAAPGLLSPATIDALVEEIHERSKGESRLATGTAASNLDLYQVNCSYYDALGRDDGDYLLARALQFFAPGVPQVYYLGLLAGTNDVELLQKTRVGRDINRHYYTPAEVKTALERPVVQELLHLIRFRNAHPAFGGEFSLPAGPDHTITLQWVSGDAAAALDVDLATRHFAIRCTEIPGREQWSSLPITFEGRVGDPAWAR